MNEHITITIKYPTELDLNNNEEVKEYLNCISKDIATQVYNHIVRNNEVEAKKRQDKFIKNFLYNPRFLEHLAEKNGRRKNFNSRN